MTVKGNKYLIKEEYIAKDYRILGYKIKINRDDTGNYIAQIPKLGCIADGKTIDEAINELTDVAKEFLRLAKEDGKVIPEPD